MFARKDIIVERKENQKIDFSLFISITIIFNQLFL